MENIKTTIIKYCEEKGSWVYGGKIEDYVRDIYGSKASNASRRCRELVEEGVLEKRLVQIDEKGPKVVQYRIILEPTQFPLW